MGETFLISILTIVIPLAFLLIVVYGGSIVLSENFWLGIILLFLLPPFFLFWAFYRGLTGKRNDN